MDSINLLNKILLQGKKVLVRGDLDVPIVDGRVADGSRLEAMRETLEYLVIRDAKIILIGHLGRPDGKVVELLRLDPVADYLRQLGFSVIKLNTILGPDLHANLEILTNGEILMLENLRFDKREEGNDVLFAKDLASVADLYVNECFSTSHRAHASIDGIPQYVKSFAGLRLQLEVETLSRVLVEPEAPVVCIFGGIKLETKLPVISKFLQVADYILLGGKLGIYYEGDTNNKIITPVDYVGAEEDIGPKTITMFESVIKIAKTIVWNGPMGKFENDSYFSGTLKIAQAVADSAAFSVVGGGDTIDALNKAGLMPRMKFVSVGGGAMLEFISGRILPGLEELGYYDQENFESNKP
ncbi:MAG: phosphoglycerate kinase [Patescibacteria group bacterium]